MHLELNFLIFVPENTEMLFCSQNLKENLQCKRKLFHLVSVQNSALAVFCCIVLCSSVEFVVGMSQKQNPTV